jgi:hypothetical protein
MAMHAEVFPRLIPAVYYDILFKILRKELDIENLGKK